MKAATRRELFRRALFAAWGMATLVLVFCVILLVLEMVRKGQDPLALVKEQTDAAAPQPLEISQPSPTQDITLYFATADGRMLAPEPYRIEYSDFTINNCRTALDALIRGPQGPLTPILPPSARVNGMYLLEDGELVINFSIELELADRKLKSASLEALMIYGIVNTLTQRALKGDKEGAVTKVRFLIGDSAPRESFPAHLDVSEPISPDPRWIETAQV